MSDKLEPTAEEKMADTLPANANMLREENTPDLSSAGVDACLTPRPSSCLGSRPLLGRAHEPGTGSRRDSRTFGL